MPSPLKTEYEYITMWHMPSNGKTSLWRVDNRRFGTVIGSISWYGAWRQYCFFPGEKTVFSAGCLRDIQNFIGALMAERKAQCPTPR